MTTTKLTNSSILNLSLNKFVNYEFLLIVFVIIILITLFIMIYNLNIFNHNNLYFTTEGFKVKNDYSSKNKNEKFSTLKKKKKDPFDNNINYGLYGSNKFYEQFNTKNNNLTKLKFKNINKLGKSKIKSNTKINTNEKVKNKKEDFKNTNKKYTNNTKNNNNITTNKEKKQKSLLEEIANESNPGSVDNFQNVLDEIDNIDINTFKFDNMTNVASAYNNNIKNRLKYADKHNHSRFDKTVAKGSVLLDEFKKLISYDKYFK
jgi:hypothetical protein